MDKILLIIKREYLVRVRKKSFILMTILGPLLIASLMIVPIYLASESQEERIIAVNQQEKILLEDTEFLHYTTIPDLEVTNIIKDFSQNPYYALLLIQDEEFTIYSNQQISLSVSNDIKRQIEQIIKINNLKKAGIDPKIIENAKTEIELITKLIDEDGSSTNSNSEASMGIGFISGILIYMFIFMYGTMVMRGVIEEKTSRIVEVIISSVKPFQLMMGKIMGVAAVGLTQFILWILLTIIISTIAELTFLDASIMANEMSTNKQSIVLTQLTSITGGINLIEIFLSFIFYFLAGYLMYSSLFAAVGSAVDAEADTQQFILPITIPLILSFILIQPIMDNPDGSLAFWMSIIPFTSPVIMMVRLPFGVDSWELLLSMAILVGTFIASTWLAGRIYRIGILMYGKKVSYKELWKWMRY
jgi:ABC-2 type transport system permease protein